MSAMLFVWVAVALASGADTCLTTVSLSLCASDDGNLRGVNGFDGANFTVAFDMSGCTLVGRPVVSPGPTTVAQFSCAGGLVSRSLAASAEPDGSVAVEVNFTGPPGWGPDSTTASLSVPAWKGAAMWMPYSMFQNRSTLPGCATDDWHRCSLAYDKSVLHPFEISRVPGRSVLLGYGLPGGSTGGAQGISPDYDVLNGTWPVPVASLFSQAGAGGQAQLVFAASPRDSVVSQALRAEDGRLAIVRSMQLATQRWTCRVAALRDAAPTASLAWFADRHAEFFEPRVPVATAGYFQYLDYRGQKPLAPAGAPVGAYWDATFPFPFWGMWLGGADTPDGTVLPTPSFNDCVAIGHVDAGSGVEHPMRTGLPPKGVPVYGPARDAGVGGCEVLSYETINAWYGAAAAEGAEVYAYGNIFEFGYNLDASFNPSTCPAANLTAYCVANRLNRLFTSEGGDTKLSMEYTNNSAWQGPKFINFATGWPIAPGVVLFDPSVSPSYMRFQQSMVALQLKQTPKVAGLCLDRSDHTAQLWPSAPRAVADGVSFYNGSAGRALLWGYIAATAGFQQQLAAVGKPLLASPTNRRLDLFRSVDAFYDEFGDSFPEALADAYLGIRKTVAAWDHGQKDVSHEGSPSREAYLQTQLFLGTIPTSPNDYGDHTLTVGSVGYFGNQPMHPMWNSTQLVDLFSAYSPLFSAISGRRWLPALHVSANDTALWLNAFSVGNCTLVPVTAGAPFGNGGGAANVTIRPPVPGTTKPVVLVPGGGRGPVTSRVSSGTSSYAFALVRGCALLKVC